MKELNKLKSVDYYVPFLKLLLLCVHKQIIILKIFTVKIKIINEVFKFVRTK